MQKSDISSERPLYPTYPNASSAAATLAADLVVLGADGFANWLRSCLGGIEPVFDGRRFAASGPDQTLGAAFRSVWHEFLPQTRAVAVDGVIRAFSDPDIFGTMTGLLEMAHLAEVTGADIVLSQIGKRLCSWEANGVEFQRKLHSFESIAAFREIGETAFRVLVANRDEPTTELALEPFGALGRDVFLNGPLRFARRVVPALAPLLVLASHYTTDRDELTKMESSLAATFLIPDDPFPEFFVFRRPVDSITRYAFDIWSLPVIVAELSAGRPSNLLKPRLSNMFDWDHPSATFGVSILDPANDDEEVGLYEELLAL